MKTILKWIIENSSRLQRSATALMDDPLKDEAGSANRYLTMHCLMLGCYFMLIMRKYGFDVFSFFQYIWPIKSTNFRNPLSSSAALTILLGAPIFLFWRWMGKVDLGERYINVAMRNYMLISLISSVAINVALLFIGAKLNFPEFSLALGVVNFYWWARWTVRKYAELSKG